MPYFELVSVVIPTYKRLPMLRRAVASALAQTYDNLELIVSDDERQPGETWAYLRRLSAREPRVRITRNTDASGEAANTNNAFREARGQFIKVLHDDDTMRPTCIEEMVNALHVNPAAVVCSCQANQWADGRIARTTVRPGRPLLELITRRDAMVGLFNESLPIGVPTQLMFRRRAIEAGAWMVNDAVITGMADSLWYPHLLQHGGLLVLNRALVDWRQGEWETSSSSRPASEYDLFYERLRELMAPLLPNDRRIGSVETSKQMIRVIRALHRARTKRYREALGLAIRAPRPRAWWLAMRWAARRVRPNWCNDFRAIDVSHTPTTQHSTHRRPSTPVVEPALAAA